jgi:ribonuclease III
MTDLVTVFSTQSPIEAEVVKGLLEAHGIAALLQSNMPRTAFPMALHELRLSVSGDNADRARRLIESHREERSGARVIPFGAEFEPLEREIGYRFRDRGLLEHALTHRSRVHEDASGGVFDNESMEFLGDSILGFVIADMLFHEFPHHNEGQKSKLKASIVSAASLARLGDRINLGGYLILGRGEEKTGGRRKHALIADSYEALIAAIYLDGGLDPARDFILRELGDIVEDAGRPDYSGRDHKSRLQEALQALGRPLPVYRVAGEIGPDHRKMFHIEVLVGGEVIAQGAGRTKKDAEQDAAKAALQGLSSEGNAAS